LASDIINNCVKGVKTIFRASEICLVLPHRLPKRVDYPDRVPTTDKFSKLIDVADIRDKVI